MRGSTRAFEKAMPRRFSSFTVALAVLTMLAFAAITAPWLAPFDPNSPTLTGEGPVPPLSRRLVVEATNGHRYLATAVERTATGLALTRRDGTLHLEAADIVGDAVGDGEPATVSRFFVLGTDRFGRDVLSRLLYGARVSFFVGLVSILVMMTLGVAIGALAALGGRLLDAVLMRVVDGLLAFPWLILFIALAGLFPGSILTLALIIGASSWMPVSRLARAELQRVGQLDFVLAARAIGASPTRVFLRHMLPHIATPLMVRATLGMAGVIVAEASLSFLGFGVASPHASWGNMINDGKSDVLQAWWISTFPALSLAATVIALSLAGDGLRDALDPRQQTPQ